MRRALRGAASVVLAIAAVVPAPSALAQLPALPVPGQPPPRQVVVYQENSVLSERRSRLEEIKVELTLLADIATFPYHLGIRAAGQTLELSGYVPNEMVRQHALDVARRSTILRVCNKVSIQTNVVMTSPQRPPAMLQKEAVQLLEQELGEPALEMSVGVQPHGLIVVSGSIDSVENKLAVSRLFRRLSGCRGVVNELIVQPIPHNRPCVVRVALQGSMLKPSSPLDAAPQAPTASPPGPKPAIPVLPRPAPPASLPVVLAGKPTCTPRKALVTLPVKILVDQAEPMVQNVWEKRLRQRVEEASDILERHCGVRLKVIEAGTWESDAKQTKLSELLQDFQKKVAPGAARLAIGFTGLPASNEEAALGCTARPLHTHILIREWKPRTEPERLEVLVHELGHFLGACHSPESDSVMRPKLGDGRVNFRAFRLGFDALSTRVMSLIAEELARGSVRGLEELSPRTRQRLLDIFAPLARTMPDDPVVADAIRQLGGAPPEPLSARQLSPE